MKISSRHIALGLLGLNAVFIFLFFDPKVHPGGDDSDYIVAAVDFLNGENFPSWHGSFYPIFLSPFIALFGENIVLLKSVSIIVSLMAFWFFAEAIKNHVSLGTYNFTLVVFACNYSLALYASTTYSEPLFMLLQSLVFYFFSRLIFETNNESKLVKIKVWAGLGVAIFLLTITRNIGIGCWIALLIFFVVERSWKSTVAVFGMFVFFNGAFALYKRFMWGITESGVEGQLSKMANKNFYNPDEGKLSIVEFLERFWENSNIYLSKHVTKFLGFRTMDSTTHWPLITVLFFLIFVFVFWVAFRRNKFVLFLLIYVGVLLSATFISQQTDWDQERLVLVFLPIIALLLGYTFYDLVAERYRAYTTRPLLIIISLLVLGRVLTVEKNIWVALTNLKGKKYYGYPEDLQNYSSISEWVGEHLAKNKNVLCRKPGISSVYGKRKFVGISSYHYTAPDSADNWLKRRTINYVILDNLGMPTVPRLLFYYLQKYPLGLTYIKEVGKNKRSYLLEIIRQPPATDGDFFSRVSAGMLIYPDAPYYYSIASNKYAEIGNDQRAVEYYTTALQQKGSKEESSSIRYQRASSFLRMEDFKKAKEDVLALIEEFPDNKNFQDLRLMINYKEAIHKNTVAETK